MALALDQWNEVSTEPGSESMKINVSDEGVRSVPTDGRIPQSIGVFTRVRTLLYQ
jgi:hypothetical protein